MNEKPRVVRFPGGLEVLAYGEPKSSATLVFQAGSTQSLAHTPLRWQEQTADVGPSRMAVSRTAQYVALYRALENLEHLPRFRDPFADAFLSSNLALLIRAARLRPLRGLLIRYADMRAPGARTSAIARTCFIDAVARQTRGSYAPPVADR